MKTTKASLFLSLIVLAALFSVEQAVAARGCETTTGTIFDQWINPQASGTKLYGTLTIYYQDLCDSPNCCLGEGFQTKMFFVLRLTKGNQLYSFSGDSGTQYLCYGDMDSQKDILFDFFETVVLPVVSPGSTSFALKAVDQVVDTSAPDNFTMLDLTIAVRN